MSGTSSGEDDGDDDGDDDLSSPLPQRQIPSNADNDDDDDDDGDASSEEEEEEDEVSDLATVKINNEYEEDYQLSQKTGMMHLRRH
jgi:hypothetical protein